MGKKRGIPEEGTDVARQGGVIQYRDLGKAGMAETESRKKK